MRTSATTAPPAPPEPSSRGSARGAAPPGNDAFAMLLESTQARTATAEGPKTDTPRPTSAADRDQDVTSRADQAPADVPVPPLDQPVAQQPVEPAPQQQGQPTPSQPQGEQPQAPSAPAVDPALQSPAGPATEATATPAQPAAATLLGAQQAQMPTAAPAAAQAPATPAVGTAQAQQPTQLPADPAAQAAVPAQPQAAQAPATQPQGLPTDQAQQQAQAAPADTTATQQQPDATAEQPQAGTAQTAQQGAGTGTNTGQQQGQGQPSGRPAGAEAPQAQPQAASAPVEAPAQAPVQAAQPSAQAAEQVAETAEPAPVSQPTPAATQPTSQNIAFGAPVTAAGPASAAGAMRSGAVPLASAAEAVQNALQIAAKNGITRAKLHVHPAELGAIELHLRHTASGLTARVIADSPEAAAHLQENAEALKQVLDNAGVGLLGLDIGARGDQQPQHTFAGLAGGAFGDASQRFGSGRRGGGSAGADDAEQVVVPVRQRLPLPGTGALLDVIA